jgi:hypothetical protein
MKKNTQYIFNLVLQKELHEGSISKSQADNLINISQNDAGIAMTMLVHARNKRLLNN